MGAAFFIALDNPDPGFDPFVDGKLIANEANAIARIAKSLGLKSPDEYFGMGGDDLAGIAEDFGVEDAEIPDAVWFDADEGIQWSSALRKHLEANPTTVKRSADIAAQFSEFESVFTKAKAIGARWHLEVDF